MIINQNFITHLYFSNAPIQKNTEDISKMFDDINNNKNP